MSYIRYQLEQKQNHLLNEEYKKLKVLYYALKDNAEKLYDIGMEEEREDFDLLDNISLMKEDDKDTFFINYKNKKKNLIRHKLTQQNLKEDKIKKLFEIKNKRMHRHLEYLDENTLGTTLNLLEEFYANIYRDLERNSIKESDYIIDMNDNFDYKFDSSIFFQSNNEKKSDEIYSFDRSYNI